MKKALRSLKSRAGIMILLLTGCLLFSGVLLAISFENLLFILPFALFCIILLILVLFQLATMSSALRTQKRLSRIEKTVNDIAGTTGRTAPVIREIREFSTGVAPGTSSSIGPLSIDKTSSSAGTSKALNLPAVTAREEQPRNGHKVMVIADEFTATAFASEWHQVRPTPETWCEELDNHDFALLFIESAWEGNDGSWRYHLVGQSAPRPAVVELINECQQRNIPVVFWNKEDPPHFDDFLDIAKLADYVFTTEGDLIEEYKRILGHDQVAVLPFAAQPTMHNPARPGRQARDRDIAFGGTYFRHKYPERREQLEYLLPAAAKFELDIFSRLYENDEKYQFPAPFDQYVRGSLSYSEMVGAYHAYKVILNVNSVVDSDTMCARRIFEATASGAAVVSAPSAAIDKYFPNELITTAQDEDSTYHRLRALLRSDKYRQRLVHLAQRHIWENHTYKFRANQILGTLGLAEPLTTPSVSVVVSTNRPESVEYMVQNICRQNYEQIEVVILTHGFALQHDDLAFIKAAGIPVTTFEAPPHWKLGKNLNQLVHMASGDVIVRMDDDDWYGANYVRDTVNALEYSGAALVGKAASYIYFEEKDLTILSYQAHEHRYTDFVRGATFAASKDVFMEYRFPEVGVSEDSTVLEKLNGDGAKIYSADRFNFVVNRWKDETRHTWTVSDEQLFATGDVTFIGHGYDQVDL